jgi:hypothetical protein
LRALLIWVRAFISLTSLLSRTDTNAGIGRSILQHCLVAVRYMNAGVYEVARRKFVATFYLACIRMSSPRYGPEQPGEGHAAAAACVPQVMADLERCKLPGGAWTTSPPVSSWNISLSRTSPGKKDGSTGSASQSSPRHLRVPLRITGHRSREADTQSVRVIKVYCPERAGTLARHRLPATPGGTARAPHGKAMTGPGPR